MIFVDKHTVDEMTFTNTFFVHIDFIHQIGTFAVFYPGYTPNFWRKEKDGRELKNIIFNGQSEFEHFFQFFFLSLVLLLC